MSHNHPTPKQVHTLRYHVEQALKRYFSHLDGEAPVNLYRLVLEEVELPLIKITMEHVHGNQCKAAELLGISRGTLRKKLELYGV